jgi:hypothetical protein
MTQNHLSRGLRFGQLEASYSLYCRALRILIREEKTIRQVQRSFCWHRLDELHQCLPWQYQDPNHLYRQLKGEICPEISSTYPRTQFTSQSLNR